MDTVLAHPRWEISHVCAGYSPLALVTVSDRLTVWLLVEDFHLAVVDRHEVIVKTLGEPPASYNLVGGWTVTPPRCCANCADTGIVFFADELEDPADLPDLVVPVAHVTVALGLDGPVNCHLVVGQNGELGFSELASAASPPQGVPAYREASAVGDDDGFPQRRHDVFVELPRLVQLAPPRHQAEVRHDAGEVGSAASLVGSQLDVLPVAEGFAVRHEGQLP